MLNDRAKLNISLDLLEENFLLLKRMAPQSSILFMVKSNAYGHGDIDICSFANKNCGVKEFGVASIAEAMNLRKELPEEKFEIYVFSDHSLAFEKTHELYSNYRIIPVISSLNALKVFLGSRDLKNVPLCLKFNTGMNRIGISIDSLSEVISLLKKHSRKNIFHLMTHLASSFKLFDNNSSTSEQIKLFNKIKNELRGHGIDIDATSFSNSGAIEQEVGFSETHIRPGLMIYGPTSLEKEVRNHSKWKGACISSLETYVLEAFNVKKNDRVGYGGSLMPHDGRLYILGIGYGDGLPTRLSGLSCKINELSYRVVGRVNMDMLQILSEEVSSGSLNIGQPVKLWNSGSDDYLDICDQLKQIPYEIFCHLSPRVKRGYHKST